MNIELILMIIGCALVTAVPRVIPLMYLSVEHLPKASLQWLSFVPVAIMGALLFPDIFIKENRLFIHFENTYLLAAIPSLMVAWWTKSFFGTIACAMGLVSTLRYFGWM